jgi:hypothetical protein
MQKKNWQKPQLIILVRGNPENAVLMYCKGDSATIGPSESYLVDWSGDPSNDSYRGCRGEPLTLAGAGNMMCSGYNCKMKTEGFSGENAENDCPGNTLSEAIIEKFPECDISAVNGSCYKSGVLCSPPDPLVMQCRCGCCLTLAGS